MPAQKPAASRGRRNPALLAGEGPDAVQPEDAVDPLEDHLQIPGEPDAPEDPLLYAGDVVTANVTLAVDFGDGRTNFVGYKATTRVQPGEDHPDVYARLVTVVNEGVISATDDVEVRLEQYMEDREARLQEATQNLRRS